MTGPDEQTIPENDAPENIVRESDVPESDVSAKDITVKDTPEKETAPSAGKGIEREAAVLLLLSFLASFFYWFGHCLTDGPYHGMGIGLTATHWVLTAAVLIMAKLRSEVKADAKGIFLLFLSLLLSSVYGVFANTAMKLMNLPVLLLLTAQALFTLTGRNGSSPLSGQGLTEGFRRYAGSLFRCWNIPFRALARLGRDREGKRTDAGLLAIGFFAAVMAAVLALVILSSADTVFSGIMENAVQKIQQVDGVFIKRLILALLTGMLIFSHRFAILQPAAEIRPTVIGAKNPTAVRMVLCSLALVYGLFAYVQIRYLFAGTESVRMSGGYAAYARSGFFQLVAVAFLTLCLILPSLVLCGKDKAVRVLCALVTLLTGVIDISAFFRMRLYIDAYGLTTLRIVTMWGIGMILTALLAALVKAFRPAVRICPLLAAAALTTWTAMNWVNIDRRVAEDLVARYNAAQHEDTMDITALAFDQYWSPEYYAAFEKISDPEARAEALALLDARGAAAEEGERPFRDPKMYDWSLSYLKVPVVEQETQDGVSPGSPQDDAERIQTQNVMSDHAP